MRRVVILGLVMCLGLFTGCGSNDDAVMAEHLQIQDEFIALLEKGDPKTIRNDPQFKKLEERAREVEKTVRGWPVEKQQTMLKKYETEIKQRTQKIAAKWTGPGVADF